MSITARFIFNNEPGCFVKDKTRPKTDRLVLIYLTINILILFKVSKTTQNHAKIC
jgi:hypothetical protein